MTVKPNFKCRAGTPGLLDCCSIALIRQKSRTNKMHYKCFSGTVIWRHALNLSRKPYPSPLWPLKHIGLNGARGKFQRHYFEQKPCAGHSSIAKHFCKWKCRIDRLWKIKLYIFGLIFHLTTINQETCMNSIFVLVTNVSQLLIIRLLIQ